MEEHEIRRIINEECTVHHQGMDHAQKSKKSNSVFYAIIGLISLLLIFSVVQAVNINQLKESSVPTSAITGQVVKTSSPPPSRAAAPAMVGGC